MFSQNEANTDTCTGFGLRRSELLTLTRQVAPGRSLLLPIALFTAVSVTKMTKRRLAFYS